MDGTIVSLVPSLTELAWWLGAGERLVGRTRFCTEPAGEVGRVPILGGTKNPRVERIVALAPALVLANKEENRREDIEALRGAGLRVLLTDPNSVPEAVAMIREVGAALGAPARAEELAREIEAELAKGLRVRRRVFVPIWKEPLLALGGATYGSDMLACAGGENVFAEQSRYPETTIEEVAGRRPELVLLPDEPYPFKAEDEALFARIAPTKLVDGKLLWWYGPRMPAALRGLRALLQGEA